MRNRDRMLLIEAIDLLEDAYSYLVRRGLSIEEEISEFLDRSCLELNLSRWPRDSHGRYDPSLDIEEYFSKTIHKERGERVSAAFREKYRSLRAEHLGGAEMFDQLLSFALGPCRAQPEAEVSGLAILAYLFEQCDIFESPPGEKT